MTTYLRYRIDASRDLGSDRLHEAGEAVDQPWHDTEQEAQEYATTLLEDDDELILTVQEFAIESDSEPDHADWHQAAHRQPRRELDVA